MKKNEATLKFSKEEMKAYGYQVVDAVLEHFDTQDKKLPVAKGSRKEMDNLFLEEAPENATDAKKVLDFVPKEVVTKSYYLYY